MDLSIYCFIFLATIVSAEENFTVPETTNKPTTTIPTTTIPTTTTTQKEEVNYDYIVKLEYTFKEAQVPSFITGIIAAGIEETKISVADLINLSKIETYSLNETLKFLEILGAQPKNVFKVDTLETFLNDLQVPFQSFYASLNQTLGVPPNKIEEIINALEISTERFTLALVLGKYNVYDVLRNGTFTSDAIDKALESAQLDITEVFEAIRDVFVDYLKKLDRESFHHLLDSLHVDQKSLLKLWNTFNITSEDVYRVTAFRDILEEIIYNLNREISVGVVTKDDKVLVHAENLDRWQHIQHNLRIKARSFVNNNLTVDLSETSRRVSEKIVEIPAGEFMSSKVKVARDYQKMNLENCTYVTYIRNNLLFQTVDVVNYKDYLLLEKNNRTIFNPGSPVICKGTLYGMAAWENASSIQFDTFYGQGGFIPGSVYSGSNSFLSNHYMFIINSILSLLCSYYVI